MTKKSEEISIDELIEIIQNQAKWLAQFYKNASWSPGDREACQRLAWMLGRSAERLYKRLDTEGKGGDNALA